MESLLVLVLAFDPSAEPEAAFLASELHQAQIQAVSATAAREQLTQAGVHPGDMLTNHLVAQSLTKQRRWAVVGVRRLGGDPLALDARITISGRLVPFTALAASSTAARLSLTRGVREILAGLDLGTSGPDAALGEAVLRADWTGVLALVPATAATPRQRFLMVQALTRLDRHSEARQAAAALAEAFPQDVYSKTALELISSQGQALDAQPIPGDDGSNTLR